MIESLVTLEHITKGEEYFVVGVIEGKDGYLIRGNEGVLTFVKSYQCKGEPKGLYFSGIDIRSLI
jgi:hypothetical protein